MSSRIKCVLFDLDGTLVSTGGAGNRALDEAFARLHGVGSAMAGVDPAGKTDPAIIREIFQARFGRDCSRAEMLAVQECYLSLLRGECDRSAGYSVMEGIPLLLDRLKDLDVLTGLGTGNLERGAGIKLERAQIFHFFPFGGYGSDSESRPELLRVAHRKAAAYAGAEIAAERTFIVGDTERDIQAARAANFKVIAVATGHTPGNVLRRHEPDFFLEDFTDCSRFLDMIHSGSPA